MPLPLPTHTHIYIYKLDAEHLRSSYLPLATLWAGKEGKMTWIALIEEEDEEKGEEGRRVKMEGEARVHAVTRIPAHSRE